MTPTHATNRARDQALDRSAQVRLVESLRRSTTLNPATSIEGVKVIETHISYVLLTAEYAYKIKKAVRLPFLDFSTLASRRYYCEEELRLNRAVAPSVYLDVVGVGGTVDAPILGGSGPALEYALRMRQFQQDAVFSEMLARGLLSAAHIDNWPRWSRRFISARAGRCERPLSKARRHSAAGAGEL